MSDTPKFEDVLKELDERVRRLESGDMPLEEALAAFEEGMKLAGVGQAMLEAAEKRIEVLTSKPDGSVAIDPAKQDLPF